jgi:hypothetical protein
VNPGPKSCQQNKKWIPLCKIDTDWNLLIFNQS